MASNSNDDGIQYVENDGSSETKNTDMNIDCMICSNEISKAQENQIAMLEQELVQTLEKHEELRNQSKSIGNSFREVHAKCTYFEQLFLELNATSSSLDATSKNLTEKYDDIIQKFDTLEKDLRGAETFAKQIQVDKFNFEQDFLQKTLDVQKKAIHITKLASKNMARMKKYQKAASALKVLLEKFKEICDRVEKSKTKTAKLEKMIQNHLSYVNNSNQKEKLTAIQTQYTKKLDENYNLKKKLKSVAHEYRLLLKTKEEQAKILLEYKRNLEILTERQKLEAIEKDKLAKKKQTLAPQPLAGILKEKPNNRGGDAMNELITETESDAPNELNEKMVSETLKDEKQPEVPHNPVMIEEAIRKEEKEPIASTSEELASHGVKQPIFKTPKAVKKTVHKVNLLEKTPVIMGISKTAKKVVPKALEPITFEPQPKKAEESNKVDFFDMMRLSFQKNN